MLSVLRVVQLKLAAVGLFAAAALFVSGGVASAAVTPLDTFSFDISGFNSTGTSGFLITPALTATFGTTQTFPAAGTNGQDITITSSEAVNALTNKTTDTFTVSTPTNFLTTAAVGGITITSLQFDLGNANSGSNTVDFALPVTANTQTGSVLFSGGTLALTPTVTLSNNLMSLTAVEGVNAGTSAINAFAVRSFTFSITYDTIPVPEPTSLALLAPGLMLIARRRRD